MTYSIVALDPNKKFVGVATASGSIAVGSRVPWARYGVGAVATQAYTNPALGVLILELIEKGLDAQKALEKAISRDPNPELRQVAVIDFNFVKAVHNGTLIPSENSFYIGRYCVCIANLVSTPRIAEEMCRFFDEHIQSMEFYEALLRALEIGHELGGDRRGDKSASILVCSELGYGRYYDRFLDIRVDYSENPVKDLRKIVYYKLKELI